MDILKSKTRTYQNGEPCAHPGCKHHLTHPCEGCGRIRCMETTYSQKQKGKIMGFHVCEYCKGPRPHTSSGDVFLQFSNGHFYVMPDMILHYIAMHEYLPPKLFIFDVMESSLAKSERLQTKGIPEK